MKANEAECMRRLLLSEGGNDDDPRDPGGRTSRGIIQSEWDKWRQAHAGLPTDVWKAPQASVLDIYDQNYWDKERCDELPAGVDYAVFDYGVNSGIGRSGKVLRRVVGLPDDSSSVTDLVLAAVAKRDPKVVVSAICDERLQFLKGLKTWGTFGRGWAARVAEVRTSALSMAAASQGVKIPVDAPAAIVGPPWLSRMTALLGLYEFPGAADNPAILAMAKACGGNIAKGYKHDATAWCAMGMNYCLISSGQPGDDSLLALDFRKYGVKLPGAAVGAIATKQRDGGGHTFLVVGRKGDLVVGRGCNQQDMVCDEVFDPDVLRYNWPAGFPAPDRIGFDRLPLVVPAAKVHRDFSSLPDPTRQPGKGTIAPPKAGKVLVPGSVAAAGGSAGLSHWLGAHPIETGFIVAGALALVGGGVYALHKWHRYKSEAPTAGLVPVAA